MKKYWYEEGMCRALGYKGQYPLIYTSNDGETYQRKCMCCDMIFDGRCQMHETCEILLSAPKEMKYHWQLRDKKMG